LFNFILVIDNLSVHNKDVLHMIIVGVWVETLNVNLRSGRTRL